MLFYLLKIACMAHTVT